MDRDLSGAALFKIVGSTILSLAAFSILFPPFCRLKISWLWDIPPSPPPSPPYRFGCRNVSSSLDDLITPISKSSSSVLPPDILLDILCRLPVKSIVRFKSVSREWNNVFTDRLFVNMQFDKTSKSLISRDCFICMTSIDIPSDIIAYAPRFRNGWKSLGIWQLGVEQIVVGSSKGWVCITNEPYFLDFVITNPAIKLILHVPYPGSRDPEELKTVRVFTGFGYDEYHDDFKLLRLQQPYSTSNLRFSKIEIYSLRTGSWKSISSSENIKPTYRVPLAMLGSRLYWKSSARSDNYNTRIAFFDLCNETFHVSKPVPVAPPPGVGITKSRLDVVALREESLTLIYSDYDRGEIRMWTVSLDDLTFKQIETTCLDVPPYSADKCLDWLRMHHGWIIATQRNGDLMVQYRGKRGWFGWPTFVRLFSLKKNNFVNFVNHPHFDASHVWWCFRESLIR